jgi:phosphoglycolate phosphatase
MNPRIKDIKSIVFDFDYTLADSSQGSMECINYVLCRMNLQAPSSDIIRKTIGLSLPETFKTLTGESYGPPTKEFSQLFTERADQVMLGYIKLFDSVKPTVEILLQNDLSMGIVSTKYRYRIEAFLRRENLGDAFKVIVGGEDITLHKPDPTGLIIAINKLDSTIENTIYVGDSTTDAETARRAAIRFIAVTSGVTPEQDLRKYLPYAIIADLRMLPELFV